jgi:hypothetical protein
MITDVLPMREVNKNIGPVKCGINKVGDVLI